jgi:hypothetical protein
MGRRRRRNKKACISREDLAELHALAKEANREDGNHPGSEAYSLTCAFGACLGNWPRVRKDTIRDLMLRLACLRGD